ncbi:hypothetical protein KR044_013334 [Drosophila immigrans]|nr:hypothetical protein KR044_013334 [Drosophila immigrans]
MEECRIKAVNRSHNVINMKYNLNKRVSELQMNLKLLKRERGGWHPFLYDINIDMCEFFKRPYKFVVFNLIYKYGETFTNLNHTCPYLVSIILTFILNYLHSQIKNCLKQPNTKILVLNWTLSQREVIAKFPVDLGVYAVHTTWFTNKKKFIEMNGTIVYE